MTDSDSDGDYDSVSEKDRNRNRNSDINCVGESKSSSVRLLQRKWSKQW